MIFARTHSRGAISIQGSLITIEAYTAAGLPQIVIIELREASSQRKQRPGQVGTI